MNLQLPPDEKLAWLGSTALRASILLWMALAVSTVFVMALGTDEAWVLNGLRSAIHPQTANLSTELIVTSGGLFALINTLIEWASGNQVWLHRLPSLGFLVLAFAMVLGAPAASAAPARIRWLMLAPLIAIPGTAELGTAALGTSTGLFLMMAAMRAWTSERLTWPLRTLYAGLLYGLAAASRFDLVLFGPALLFCSCVKPAQQNRIQISFSLPGALAVTLGFAIFLANQYLMSLPANAVVAEAVSGSTGLASSGFNYPKVLNHWATLASFIPLSLLAIAAAGSFWTSPAASKPASGDAPCTLQYLLLVTGLALLAGWMLRAPIPHLRYALPGLYCFAALASLAMMGLAMNAATAKNARHGLLCLCIGLGCAAGGIGTTVRSLVMADSDVASWEWSNEAPLDYFRRFDARSHQSQAVEFLKQGLPENARIYSYVPYAYRYLANRPVIAIDDRKSHQTGVAHQERFLLLTPAVGTYLFMPPKAALWIENNATLIRQMGRYSVYRLPPGTDSDLDQLALARTNYLGHPASEKWFGR